jgi:two-component system, NarL family, response regulator NreC
VNVTILLADDHHVVRQGLRALLHTQPGFLVVGEESDGLRVAEAAARLAPDILVMDLAMPGLDGMEVIERVRRDAPQTRIVVLSVYSDEVHVMEALRRGAGAYVVKAAQSADLATAIREVMKGRRYLSPPLPASILADVRRAPDAGRLDVYETLTSREREVLHLSADGLSNPEIAVRLGISTRTVETHRANLLRKLGLRGQTELVRYAVRRGIVPGEGR